MTKSISLLIMCLLAISCGTGIDPVDIIGGPEVGQDNFRTVDESVDVASYTMILTGDGIAGTMVLEDNDAKTTWSPVLGIIFLNTDEDAGASQPIGTLDINFGEGYQDMIASSGTVVPEKFRVSKTDQRMGTAMQLNGRLYQPTSICELINVEVGYNFIRAVVNCDMERIKVFESDEDEMIEFMAEFTAKRK